MRTYDVRCPICGTMNTRLDLVETEGSMECIACGNVTQSPGFQRTTRIPVLNRKGTISNRESRMMIGRR